MPSIVDNSWYFSGRVDFDSFGNGDGFWFRVDSRASEKLENISVLAQCRTRQGQLLPELTVKFVGD